jgi:molecular chaperone DnaK
VEDRSRILGIDLGTTNTCVAHVRNHVAKMVPSDRGNLVLPSVVALSASGELLVGGVAKDQMLTNPANTIYGAKRLIGRKFNSRTVQAMKDRFAYEIVEGPNGEAAVQLGGKVYTLPEISALVLAQVKRMSEQFLGGPVEDAIVSVPAYYNDNQRNAVKEAGRLAGLTVKRIVNEPTAAALAYAHNRSLSQKILVYDLGGGTFDVSVLQLHGNVFEVLATGGDTFLGGVDFDNRIVDYVLDRFRKESKVDLRQNAIAVQRIRNAAEACKIDLTLIPNAVVELPFIEEHRGKPLDLRIPVSREQLNALCVDLVQRTFDICDQVLGHKGIAPREISEIILVGGQSRMPLVQQLIRDHFGRPARKGVHPDECVAQGAALLGDSIGRTGSLTLLDVLSMPIGIATAGGRFRRILDRNTTIPTARSFRLPAPREPRGDIVIEIFQGDSDLVVDNEYLGTLRIDGALSGHKIDFKLSEECLLAVTVDRPGAGPSLVQLATHDTPEALRAALANDRQLREGPGAPPKEPASEGFFASLRRRMRS